MFTAAELVAFVLSMLGMPYWYGTCVYMCSESTLQSKARQYPSHYANSRMSTYRKHIDKRMVSMDCVGMIKGFFWTNGGKGVVEYINGGAAYTNKYASNGCPDKSANGMLAWCKSQGCKWGKMDTMPEIPGALVFLDGHVGVYIGGGYVVEARGFNYGVVRTQLKKRPWKNWALLPDSLIQYDGSSVPVQPEVETAYKLGDRTLKRGVKGADVEEMQTRLNALGYSCGVADGDFGANTEKGVRAFQTASRIEVDGKFGKESLKALKAAESVTEDDTAVYVVETGDSLWKIATEKLGKGSRYKEIMELNDMGTTVLVAGQKLKIPKK